MTETSGRDCGVSFGCCCGMLLNQDKWRHRPKHVVVTNDVMRIKAVNIDHSMESGLTVQTPVTPERARDYFRVYKIGMLAKITEFPGPGTQFQIAVGNRTVKQLPI